MELILLVVVILVMIAALIALIALTAKHGYSSGSGFSTTAVMGASYELLSQDQRKAAEVIVEDKSGARRGDSESDEPFGLSTDEHSE